VIILAYLVLLSSIPAILLLFALLPGRRAVVVGSIAAWLLLPPMAIPLPGLPDFGKFTAGTAGILLGTLLFEPNRLLTFRPRWVDLPISVWCLCPFFSAISNNLGAYDGLTGIVTSMTFWLFPYMIGRLYLTDGKGLREFALGMVTGGVCLILPCLYEMRMSGQLLSMVYGLGTTEMHLRYGGWRPRVFFSTGLELGLWMNVVALVAWWLWRNGLLPQLWRIRSGAICAALVATAFLCRTLGATMLFLAGIGALWLCWRTKTKWALWVLLCAVPLYYCIRIPDLWSGEQAVDLVSYLGHGRAISLQFRLDNEDLLIAKALQRPIFGWGGWGRNLVYGVRPTVTDGLWIVAFGCNGFLGLCLFTAALLLPPVLFVRRFPVERWSDPDLAPAAVIAVILDLFLLDSLSNGMLNVIYLIAAGGLASVVSSSAPMRKVHDDNQRAPAARPWRKHSNSRTVRIRASRQGDVPIAAVACSPLPRGTLAARYRRLGRTLKDHGRPAEAKTAWLSALDLLTEPLLVPSSTPSLSQDWCDCANDLAWLLLSTPDPAVRDPAHAALLAAKAAAAHPECSVYWNTLGAAHYRAGNFEAAIAALDRATALSDGGTAFDHVFLAMAYAQLAKYEQAQRYFERARRWMEQYQLDHPELLRLCDEAMSILPASPETSTAAH
jgi:hypothetical protein